MKVPLLIDLDGVLRIGNSPAPGLIEFFEYLSNNNQPACVLSNSTLSNAEAVNKYFESLGIFCPVPIITSADAAFHYAKENYKSVKAYCSKIVSDMFADIDASGEVEAVVIGDIGTEWNFDLMNEIFLHVLDGADIIAMQVNRFWTEPDRGRLLDVGPFVKAIEYATEKKAVLIGKPAPLYFQSALNLIGADTGGPFLMLGDDLETDIAGAQKIGGKGILIYTGKSDKKMLERSEVKPDYEANNLFEVIEFLETGIIDEQEG